jgi:hypothetical protein
MLRPIHSTVVVVVSVVFLAFPGIALTQEEPLAVSTFNCIGLYWSPPDGSPENLCVVRYRQTGAEEWKQALPLWFDARQAEELPVEHRRQYRGSIVNLTAGTSYEIEVSLQKTGRRSLLYAQTWDEHFPVGETVTVSDGRTPLVVDRSGTPQGYILYAHPPDLETATIDVQNTCEQCVEVRGSYVILRGLTLRNAQRHGIRVFQGCHDVIIEGCDISGWGRIEDDGWGHEQDSAIYSAEADVKRLILQRNLIHQPRGDSNTWKEWREPPSGEGSYHPIGPQATCFRDSEGNHVIRYNTIWSDDDHQYNDILGGSLNHGARGFPNRDSDIYGNLLSHCWDDAIESEGANCNVRIWGNYSTESFTGVACASTLIGPLYVWRNLCSEIRIAPNKWNGSFLKTGDELGGGRIFVFHNTILQPVLTTSKGKTTVGAEEGFGGDPLLNVTSRNNILHARSVAIRDSTADPAGDYDYDLYTGELRAPDRHEMHGIQGEPVYVNGSGLKGSAGLFWLSSASPGYDGGVPLPNFNDDYVDRAPDVGAHEADTPAMEFGAEAYPEELSVAVENQMGN